MKSLVISAVASGLICAAGLWASTLSLEMYVDGEPYDGSFIPIGTQVDVKVVQSTANPTGSGGEITVTMFASGGLATDTTPACDGWFFPIGECWDWESSSVGFYDNGDGTWTAWMGKIASTASEWGMVGTPGIGTWIGYPGYGGWAYESTMEFYFITSQTTDLIIEGTWDGVSYDVCTCYGDVTDDGEVSIADVSAIVGLLSPAYAGTTPPYTACPPPEGWECADVTGDGCISIADLSALSGYLNPAYTGTTPPYTGPCMPSP
ncbi:MAG: dockerin type I repeat-containing protein [Planctomycetota bacterium]